MQLIVITENESGQRLDKYLKKFMPEAPNSFFYKMLRKKNITLNKGKAEGNEKIKVGDEICFFLAEETIAKFREMEAHSSNYNQYKKAYQLFQKQINIIFENKHVIIFNKPAGVLSQKAKEDDCSMNEYLIGYLLENQRITEKELMTFKPSICNRLDRNTSGLVICGKSLLGLQVMGDVIKNRALHKYYRCIVSGIMEEEQQLDGYLYKNDTTNKVSITKTQVKDSSPIITRYHPISHSNQSTLLEVELVTGKTHQIRAHLSSIKHPIVGDYKYGNKKENDKYKEKYKIFHQLLHAYRLEFKEMPEFFEDMNHLSLIAPMPPIYAIINE